jgi:PmbA protein
LAQEDPFGGLPDASELATEVPDLRLFDSACGAVSGGEAVARANRIEDAARAFDARITNSEGATFARSVGAFALVTSGGFRGGYAETYASVRAQLVVPDEGGKLRTAGYWSGARILGLLESEEHVGREAARRTLARLGARKLPSASLPVVFEADAARSLLDGLTDCVCGDAVYTRSSYLVDRLGTRIASDRVTIVDDPLVESGPGSRPFDGDGLPSRRNLVVERGVLKTFLLDVYSARKLGMKSTGSAEEATHAGAGISNFVLQPGTQTPAEILRTTRRGLYVTSLMGSGFNAATGDFSRGATGYFIEGGELAFPVSEVTISLNFDELLRGIDAVGNDLQRKASIACPTIRVAEMTISGA